MIYSVYIARCQDNSLYVGSTELVPAKRIDRYNSGQGAKWFTPHGAGTVVYTEQFLSLLQARRREAQIKRWSRQKKERLIEGLQP